MTPAEQIRKEMALDRSDREICDYMYKHPAWFGFTTENTNLFKTLVKSGSVSDEQLKGIMTDCVLANNKLNSVIKLYLIAVNQKIKLNIITRVHKHTLDKLFSSKEGFETNKHHYDWWMFPMTVPTDWRWPKRNYDCSCDKSEAEKLITDSKFVESYCQGITLFLDALESSGWNNYPVRYARLMHSVSLFLETAHKTKDEDLIVPMTDIALRVSTYVSDNCLDKPNRDYDLFSLGYKKLQHLLSIEQVAKCTVAF